MNEPMTQNQRRAELLAEAASKPIKRVRQYDGFTQVETAYHEDCMMRPDADGDCLFGSETDELRNTDCVRLQIPKNVPPADAVRVIRKLLALVERDAGITSEPPAAPAAAPDIATATLKAALALTQRRQLPGEDVVF